MKKASIVIPLYNVEKFIRFALQSASAQTYPNIEILVVDDESSDGGVEICRQFDDPRIKIFQQENRGLAGARNTGIRNAQGDYIAFLDADDLWEPDKLEKHIRHLESAPDVGVSFSYSKFIDQQNNPIGLFQFASKLKDITPLDVLCRSPISNGSAGVFRKEVFEDIAFTAMHGDTPVEEYFDENFRDSEDIECWMRIAVLTDWKMEGVPEALTMYRINPKGMSANLYKKMTSWEDVLDKIRTYAPEEMVKWEHPGRAYHLRYLSRRATTLRDKVQAVQLFSRAIKSYWPLIIEEPLRTGITGSAAFLLWVLPESVFDRVFMKMMQVTGDRQRRRLLGADAEPPAKTATLNQQTAANT